MDILEYKYTLLLPTFVHRKRRTYITPAYEFIICTLVYSTLPFPLLVHLAIYYGELSTSVQNVLDCMGFYCMEGAMVVLFLTRLLLGDYLVASNLGLL